MSSSEYIDKFCIIGAGAAGLAASKCLKSYGISFDVIEAAEDVGGIWIHDRHGSPVYKNTHLISPKQVQAFSDFPMPEHYPDFPSHKLVLEYLRSYASYFQLYEHVQFNTSVKHVKKAGSFWKLTLSNGQNRCYRGLIIANGHHSAPKYPSFSGQFNGTILHSRDYKTPDQLSNKRVLIVGAGQSGIDIAVESAITAKETFHSTRRGFICLKKYILGRSTEQWYQELPIIKNLSIKNIIKFLSIFWGVLLRLEGINLKKCRLMEEPKWSDISPIVGDRIYLYYAQNDIIHKPNIRELKGDKVVFEDGSEEHIDLIIYATGYQVSFPFLDRDAFNWQREVSTPDLFLHIFHPQYDDLFVIGMINPLGAHWTVYERQSQLVATYIKAKRENLNSASDFDKLKVSPRTQKELGLNMFHYPQKDSLIIDKAKYMKVIKRMEDRLRTYRVWPFSVRKKPTHNQEKWRVQDLFRIKLLHLK